MSKLRTYQLQNPDSATVNIELDQSGGTTVSGILTASSGVVGNVTGTATTATNLADAANITTGTISNDRLPATITKNLTGNVTGNLTGNLESTASLAGISSSISDTAVDVFVYDTRKDSDGGAWRKRTQHTSWYNETLNTSTRGSRREFPSVAVIVGHGKVITIYDGDDPDLPMWLEFPNSGMCSGDVPISSVSMLNGILCAGGSTEFDGVRRISFIDERFYQIRTSTLNKSAPFSQRSTYSSYVVDNTKYGVIINDIVNDVAMTVLPNAPIDIATGLPVPTIAVATNGGVSVIKDDGTVVDTVSNNSGYTLARSVEWSSNNDLLFVMGDSGGGFDYFHTYDGFNTSDNTITIDTKTGSTKNVRSMFRKSSVALAYGVHSFDAFTVQGSSVSPDYTKLYVTAKSDAYEYAIRSAQGLTHISENPDSSGSLVSYATTSYATGWLHGDIKGAFLSDTTVESLTANTNLVSNFVQGGTNRLTSETYDDGDTSWQMVDDAGSANGYVSIELRGLTIGQSYIISMTWDNNATLDVGYNHRISHLNGLAGENVTNFTHWNKTNGSSETLTGVFVAQSVNDDDLVFYANAITLNVSNFVVRAVDDEDRSVNNNGLQVNGTITKSAVATGAELVAYSGFSGSNYLLQPYNSDLDMGTGEFCVMGWFKASSSPTTSHRLYRRGVYTGSAWSGGIYSGYINANNTIGFNITPNGYSTIYAITSSGTYQDGNWHHLVQLRNGSGLYQYIDGRLDGSSTNSGVQTTNLDNSTATLVLGGDQNTSSTSFWSIGDMALWRVSATAPSPEQIKKIYEDEKVLFQENAACTLYGSSDAVTALAYDDSTNLLYAGTSSGRSDFQGLRRINNTTTAVTTAMSASNGLVAEQ